MNDTIFALSSGRPPAGVAVIRISGPATRFVLETIFGRVPMPRRAAYGPLRDHAGEPVDFGIVLSFPGPASFTGEDVAELHLHGGRAVVTAMLAVLAGLPGLRPADRGEFTRRAFDNGRLDLTAVEGIADLIAAETEQQRRQALRQLGGGLAGVADDWRRRLLQARALIEAELDFSDEEDVSGRVSDAIWPDLSRLAGEIGAVLAGAAAGERVRDGFEIAILGPPNAGKSSLLNAIAGRDVAIVTAVPGTTRDLIELHLDLGGYAVTLVDTAGLRETGDVVEAEGVRRARRRAEDADLLLWLSDDASPPEPGLLPDHPLWLVRSKIDVDSDSKRGVTINAGGGDWRRLSVRTGEGLSALLEDMTGFIAGLAPAEPALATRERHRHCLDRARRAIEQAVELDTAPLELRAEHLRQAGEALSELIGRIDVEDVLGAIFSEFCIGK